MRGFPPIHIILFAVAFALVAVPLSKLTFARPVLSLPAAPAPASVDTGKNPTLLRLRFAHRPLAVSVKAGADKLWEVTQPEEMTLEHPVALAIPAEGLEFWVTATWPEGTPDTAVSLELEPEGKDTLSQTHWSLGPTMDQIFSFSW